MERPIRRKWRAILVAVVAAAVMVPVAVIASHDFVDVPDEDYAHDAIGWVASKGVTIGCGPDIYCPDDPVIRRDMALFMQRQAYNMGTRVTSELLSSSIDSDDSGTLVKLGELTLSAPLSGGSYTFDATIAVTEGSEPQWGLVWVELDGTCDGSGVASTQGMWDTVSTGISAGSTDGNIEASIGPATASLCTLPFSVNATTSAFSGDFIAQWTDDPLNEDTDFAVTSVTRTIDLDTVREKFAARAAALASD